MPLRQLFNRFVGASCSLADVPLAAKVTLAGQRPEDAKADAGGISLVPQARRFFVHN
jgi:hypothetical protein